MELSAGGGAGAAGLATVVVTAITSDPGYRRALLASPHIDRLNLGPISTWRIAWDRPHEGNLFDLLWRRRALQVATEQVATAPAGGREGEPWN